MVGIIVVLFVAGFFYTLMGTVLDTFGPGGCLITGVLMVILFMALLA